LACVGRQSEIKQLKQIIRYLVVVGFTMAFKVTRNLVQQRHTSSTILKRLVTTRAFVPVEVEHYTSGWKTFGDLDSYSPARFQIQTFNKISPEVSGFSLGCFKIVFV